MLAVKPERVRKMGHARERQYSGDKKDDKENDRENFQ